MSLEFEAVIGAMTMTLPIHEPAFLTGFKENFSQRLSGYRMAFSTSFAHVSRSCGSEVSFPFVTSFTAKEANPCE